MTSTIGAAASAGAVHKPIEQLPNGDWKIYVKDLDGTFKPMIIDKDKILLSKKGLPRIKVSDLVKILLDSDFQDLYFYFVHCRRTKESGTLSNVKLPDDPNKNKTNKNKKRGFSQAFSIETGQEVAIETGQEVAIETGQEVAIETNKKVAYPFLLIQSHGTSTETALANFFSEEDLRKILFRAKLGQLCRQHGPRGRDYVYREIISIYLAGKLHKPYMTDDILELKDMQIVVSTYNPEVLRKEFATATQNGYFSETDQLTQDFVVQNSPNSQLTQKRGGSIRKTVKKIRRKQKRKTKSRTRNRKR